ncbi:hypothetical protein SH528x_004449 [Novipirellula sp. SH528]|uniref:hypothetical protein n=1 Tax=Novipirellula sp. SH528 TaxID=3454466 RepID=UPI003F9ED83D
MSKADSPRRSRVKIAILLCVLAFPVLLCSGAATWWFGRQTIAAGELAKKRAELVARGLPIDDQSITEFRSKRMSHEFSDRWMLLLDQLESPAFLESCKGVPIVGVTDDDPPVALDSPNKYQDDVERFLNQWSDLRAELHEIAEGSGAIWTDIEFESYATLLPRVQNTRSAARLLSLEFKDAIRRDDRDQAFHSIMATIGVSRSIESEPILIASLVHISISGMALENLKQAIELDLFNEKQLVEILDQLKSFDDFGTKYRLSIAGERAMSQPAFDDPSKLLDEDTGSNVGSRPIDALASLELFEQAEAIPTENLTDFMSGTKQLGSQMDREFQEAGLLRKYDTILTGLTMPALGAYAAAVVRNAMQTRIAKIAIGLRLFQKRNGRWPNSLDEISSKNIGIELGPTEPIGDKPFGLNVDNGAAELWGFVPENASDTTPDSPVDPMSKPEDWREHWEYWHWKLLAANEAESR